MDDTIVVTSAPKIASPSVDASIQPSVTMKITDTIKQATDDVGEKASGIDWMKIAKYALIVLILAFLGFNIFTALGKATDTTKGILGPFLSALGFGVGETVKQTVDVTAEGAKLGVDVAAGTVDDAVTLLEKSVGVKGVQFNRIDDPSKTTQDALDNAIKKQQSSVPEPDDSSSATQRDAGAQKAGYCYIGEDRGFRSCLKVNEGDQCMSGDIFPSMEICVNPNLRE
tara:strand:+ start:2224 stop:2904 length:681 start_codon:yes stop_codon:yes gene_type:complete